METSTGKIERLHLKGIHASINNEDLAQFCSKMGKVCELHRPLSLTDVGLEKDFAIVKLESTGERTEKLIRALSGSLWKGCKIRISRAKEYYKDRIEREKAETMQVIECKPIEATETKIKKKLKQRKESAFITIRKAKGLRLNRTSWNPLIYLNGKVYSSIAEKKGFSTKNKKIIFEDDETYQIPADYIETIEQPPVVAASAVKFNAEVPSSSSEVKRGKGVRRGFGTLMQVDCCIEEPRIPAHLLDNDNESRSEEILGEVTSEELEKERLRSLTILSKFLKLPVVEAEDSAQTIRSDRVQSIEDEQPSKRAKVDDSTTPASGNAVFMNVKAMKNIFAKSDGVAWNDEGIKNKEQAADVSGNLADDIIFKEAEKFGFDMRVENSEQSGGKMSSIFSSDEKKSFKLFGDGEDSKATAIPTMLQKNSSNNEAIETKVDYVLRMQFDFNDILKLAQRFSTDRSRDDIEEEWRASRRDRLREFKKRQRDNVRKEVKR